MDDKFSIRDKLQADGQQLELARSHEEKLQKFGLSLIASLYMLIRNIRLYQPDNAIFAKPLEQLKDTINTIISMDGELILQGAGNTFYLNNMLIKFDSRSFENVRQLSAEFQAHDVGGFELKKHIGIPELQEFISLFKNEVRDLSAERELAAHKLQSLKITRYERIQEILKGRDVKPLAQKRSAVKLDRKRYAMLLYARTVQYMRKYVAGLRGEGPKIPQQNASQLIQDLVEVAQNKTNNFIGMTTASDPGDAYCFHAASVATLSVVFGSALRLSREQLRDLGLAALFHDIGRVSRQGLLAQSPSDDANQRLEIQIQTVKTLLSGASLNKTSINTILAAFDSQSAYLPTGKGPHKLELNLYGKIIALADCYDLLATFETTDTKVIMELMATAMKDQFDPVLLKLFTQTMTIWTARSSGQTLELF